MKTVAEADDVMSPMMFPIIGVMALHVNVTRIDR